MTGFGSALRFILAQQRSGSVRSLARRKSLALNLRKKRFAADFYEPRKTATDTIVFLHGMSPLGISDPRQMKAAAALAAAGFRVICPEIPDIRNLQVTGESIEVFIGLVESICDNADLCSNGRVALFAPSFSGAICLKAAADPRIAGRISAICTLGAFSRIERSLHYLMHTDDADAYARLIILANFLPRLKIGKGLKRYYLAAAHDNWNGTASRNENLAGFSPTNMALAEMKRLTAGQRRILQKIENDKPFRRELGTQLLTVMSDTLAAYNVAEVAAEVRAPVFLLHGESDDVIPARESTELYPLMQRARLVVSPFIGHADTAVSLKQLPDVWRLVSGFAWYFRWART